MKNWVFKLLFLACAVTSLEAANSEKIYLSEDSISIYGKQILVNLGVESIPFLKVYSDSKGFYVLKDDLPLGFWVCKKGHVNYPWYAACFNCGSH